MGMGEPLHNLDEVVRALRIFEHPWGAGCRPTPHGFDRRVVPGIDALAKIQPGTQFGHLAQRHDRRSTRPAHAHQPHWNIATLLGAARRFPLAHHRRITFEYVLLARVNDSDMDAARLPRLLRGIRAR